MSSRTSGRRPQHIGMVLVGLCALTLALQGTAVLAVDLPGCSEAGGGAEASHVHAADDHPEGPQGLLALPRWFVPDLLLRLPPSGFPGPRPSPVFRLIQPPRFA